MKKIFISTLLFLFICAVALILSEYESTPLNTETPTQSEEVADVPKELYDVVSVADGDTIRVNMYGEKVTIRIIGIDTPEVSNPYTEQECFGEEASKRMQHLLEGQSVYLEFDESQNRYDVYDRLLAHVFLTDNTNVGATMMREGFATEYTFKYPHKYTTLYRELEKIAQDNEVGMWQKEACD